MEQICSIEGCGKPFKGRGFCEMHLLRWRKYGDPTVVRKKQPKPLDQQARCAIDGCDEVVAAHGWCQKHYMRWYRRGDPSVTLSKGNFSTPVSTRTHLFTIGQPNECWEWQGRRNPKGYGVVMRNGQTLLAHRAIYDEMVGPIAYGLTLDHLCANPPCVNPKHMEPVTATENLRRGGDPHLP